MLIKNLPLKYKGKQGDKISLQTENGGEVLVDDFLLENLESKDQPVYLALDQQPLVSRAENQKEILKELLNPQDDK